MSLTDIKSSVNWYLVLHQKFVDLNGKSTQVELVAAVVGKQIWGKRLMIGANAEVTYTLQSANKTIFPFLMSVGGGVIRSAESGCLFATNEGEALNITPSADPGAGSGIYLQYGIM